MREAISSPSRRTPLTETGSELDSHAQDNAVVIRLLAPRARFSLRIDLSLLARAKTIAGFALGMPINRYTTAAGWTAMRLGPDEWLVIDESGADLMGALAKSGVLHSATDVSHRNVAIIVSGPGAEATISTGCPQDLSLEVFPVGACSRTLFGKAEIVLFRTEDDTFRVECWRSFADFVFGLLAEGAEDAAH